MSEHSYTAEDFRETADDILKYSGQDEEVIADMLRQAADAEEELAQLKAQFELWKTNSQRAIDALSKELNSTEADKQKFKARLDAVVKECEKSKWDSDNWLASTSDAACTHNRYIDCILRAARGEERRG